MSDLKLTNKMIENYLADCLGYDELAIEDIKEQFEGDLHLALSEDETKDCISLYY